MSLVSISPPFASTHESRYFRCHPRCRMFEIRSLEGCKSVMSSHQLLNDVEDFWRTIKNDWTVVAGSCIPRGSVHVNSDSIHTTTIGKTVLKTGSSLAIQALETGSCLLRDVCASLDSAVHRVKCCLPLIAALLLRSLLLVVCGCRLSSAASIISVPCWQFQVAFLLVMFQLVIVLVSADKKATNGDRIC
ncbi:hypothetical protein Tco_1056748 [Tanacetum coccineum]|uniref:Uncharacterized protein n=1 Tax=Tanacetum coccineum TaxID=301880 RepID=A0ABQ5H4E9_9ASTR